MHNYLVVSSIISVLYSILKYALTYKENPKPDIKESIMVFACTIAGLYIYDNYFFFLHNCLVLKVLCLCETSRVLLYRFYKSDIYLFHTKNVRISNLNEKHAYIW